MYDCLDDDRSDLDAYVGIVTEKGATSVLDVGCGTGTLRVIWGLRISVVGLDPAEASLHVSRRKPGAGSVRWVLGGVADLPPLAVTWP